MEKSEKGTSGTFKLRKFAFHISYANFYAFFISQHDLYRVTVSTMIQLPLNTFSKTLANWGNTFVIHAVWGDTPSWKLIVQQNICAVFFCYVCSPFFENKPSVMPLLALFHCYTSCLKQWKETDIYPLPQFVSAATSLRIR